MELRSVHRKSEFDELQITLSGMGFYEEGMELQEMRQVLDVLQMTSNESETNFFGCDMQQALRESEFDFRPIQDGCVLNSTMKSIHQNVSVCSSPDIQAERIVVQADVHHAMDWRPPAECLPRKPVAGPSVVLGNESITAETETNNELLEPDVKRFHDVSSPNGGTNNHGESSDESLDASKSSWHEISIPVLERRIHDSGLLVSYETPDSSLSNNVTPSSTATLNNSQYSTPELHSSIREIHGPVSIRRIHDSGLYISAEVTNSSLVNNLHEENPRQISTSSADNE